VKFGVMRKADPFTAAIRAVPLLFFLIFSVNMFSVFFEGSKYIGFNKIPWWGAILLSLGIATVVALIFHFLLTGWLRRRAMRLHDQAMAAKAEKGDMAMVTQTKHSNGHCAPHQIAVMNIDDPIKVKHDDNDLPPSDTNSNTTYSGDHTSNTKTPKGFIQHLLSPVPEEPRAKQVFKVLQPVSASFLSFTHGSNDTANSVGPLVGIWLIYKYGNANQDASEMAAMEYILAFGALSMVVGLCALGHRVIQTMGHEITEISAPSGFSVELGTAFTVLFASKVGIPVSTTHCAVGAIITVGLCKSSSEGVDWTKFRSIVLAWLVTMPVSGGIAALIAYLLGHFAIKVI